MILLGRRCDTFHLFVGAQQRRKTLGKVARGNLKAMRLEASATLAKTRLGVDTVVEAKAASKKANIVTPAELAPKYLAIRDDEVRSRTMREITGTA